MNEVERLNPGLVVQARHPRPAVTRRSVALIAPSAKRVLADLQRRQRRGEIESAGQLQFITTGPHSGNYAIRVVTLPRRPDPRWAKVLIGVGSVLAGLGILVGALAWLVTAMSRGALVVACVVPVVLLAVWVKARYSRPATTVVINQNVNVGR